LTAHTRLTISPGRQGIPVSGRLYADYNGGTETLRGGKSYIALPHTRLTLSGALGEALKVALTTSDAHNLLDPTTMSAKSPPQHKDRQAPCPGVATGGPAAPRLAGRLAANRFSYEGRQFDSLTAEIALASNGVTIRNGNLTRGTMQTQFTAQLGLKNW